MLYLQNITIIIHNNFVFVRNKQMFLGVMNYYSNLEVRIYNLMITCLIL